MFNSRFAMEVVAALFTTVLGLVFAIGSLRHGIAWGENGPAAGFFPFYIGCLIVLGSLGNLVQVALARRRLTGEFIQADRVRDVCAFMVSVLAFAVTVSVLGLYVSTAAYLFCVTIWKAKLRPSRAALLGLSTALFFFVCFEYAFKLPLPKGPLLGLFGIY
jgi:hypothetical protein